MKYLNTFSGFKIYESNISEDIRDIIRNISSDELKFHTKDDGLFIDKYLVLPKNIDSYFKHKTSIKYRLKKYPNISDNILAEVHLNIQEDLQGLGLGAKMLEAFMRSTGYILWLCKGRIINNDVYKVIDKIRLNSKFHVEELEYGYIINML
jgi:hypothetical protein